MCTLHRVAQIIMGKLYIVLKWFYCVHNFFGTKYNDNGEHQTVKSEIFQENYFHYDSDH